MRKASNQTAVIYYNAKELVVGPDGAALRGFRVELSEKQPSVAFDNAQPRPGEVAVWADFLDEVSVMGECE